MLYVSLALSVVLLAVVNRIVARAQNPIPGVVLTCAGFVICPVGLLFFVSPAVAIQAALLCVLLLVLLVPRRGRRLYLPLSCVATLAAYGFLVRDVVEKRQEMAELRQQYPYESLEGRLPARPAGQPQPANPERLNSLESLVNLGGTPGWTTYARTEALRQVHERSVDTFVNNPGFGVGRMAPGANPRVLREPLPERPAVRQPDYDEPFVPPTDGLAAPLRDWDAGKMGRLHEEGIVDFVNPRGFGFAKDRQHVAGFQKHGMTKVPASTVWTVARVELVGLVVHEQPVVYVSANLPQMDELGSAPTRALDAFELEALESLRSGEDLYPRVTEDKGRMLGAIRATRQCLGCHGGSRGDLLGAFSYGLRRHKP